MWSGSLLLSVLAAALSGRWVHIQPAHGAIPQRVLHSMPDAGSTDPVTVPHGFVVRCLVPAGGLKVTGDQLTALLDEMNVDVWSNHLESSQPVDIRVTSNNQVAALEQLAGFVECSTWIEDVLTLVAQERGMDADSYLKASLNALPWTDQLAEDVARKGDLGFFENYRTYEQVVQQLQSWSVQYPHLARFVPSIGNLTHEGRAICAIHITAMASRPTAKKQIVWINGGIHAREWISSHTAMYIVYGLLSSYGTDPRVQRILELLEIVVAPQINPDGYEYSRLKDRMWRKNRRQNIPGSHGVDVNRNFDVFWGRGGSSRNPWSETYMGPYVASEPETVAVSNYVSRLNITVGIDLHSYSQLLMRPWGWTMDPHPDEAVNKKLGDGMRDVILNFSGSRYRSQTSAGLYPVTGSLDDWLTFHGRIGFNFELRDRGRHGFLLPADQILPTGQEIFEAIKFLGEFMLDEGITSA